MKTAYILASYRTPGCRANKGKFKDMRPDDLAAVAISGLVERTGIDPQTVDDVYLGCAFPEAEQGMNVGRIAALKAGLPIEVPGQTINRFCSSGLQTIATAAERVMLRYGRLYRRRRGRVDVLCTAGRPEIQCQPGDDGRLARSLIHRWV